MGTQSGGCIVAMARRAGQENTGMGWDAAVAVAAFLGGVAVVVWSTERLLAGMVGLATLLRLAPFAVAGVFSGLEPENVAVGLVAAHNHARDLPLGTVFGGGAFIVCVALGLGAVLYPLRVDVPRRVLLVLAGAPVLSGVALTSAVTPRPAGAVLLVAFVLGLGSVALASRRHRFLDTEDILEVAGRSAGWRAVGLTALGIGAITAGAEMVTFGAQRMVTGLALPAALMGMIVTPACVEVEEVVRQTTPARQGRPDVSAGNLVGTILWFVLFNLGLVTLAAPVPVSPLTRTLDWPFLIASTWLATALLWRGGVSRLQGGLLLLLYAGYVAAHALLR
jgi:cation:H+ antiporter